MKRHLPVVCTDQQYFGEYDTAGPLDDLVGVIVLAYIDHRLLCTNDWQQLLSLRLVSRWWGQVICESLISSGVRELNLCSVNDRCPYWKEKSSTPSFPTLHTLAMFATHPLATRIGSLPNLRSLVIDGWIPEVARLDKLERLAVFDSRDTSDEFSFVVPPCQLTTLVLMDQFLTDGKTGLPGIMAVLSTLPKLRSLVLSTGVDHISNDPRGAEIRKFFPCIEKFRWHGYYFEGYKHILNDFIYSEI